MAAINVTWHARRRYLERIAGVDWSFFDKRRISDREAVTAVLARSRIAPDFLTALIEREIGGRVPATAFRLGSRCTVKGETARFVMKNGDTVMTVLPLHGHAADTSARTCAEDRENRT